MRPQPKKKPNKWLVLINIPVQMGMIVFLFSVAGKWLDEKYTNEHRIYLKALTLIGVLIAFYNINRQLKELNSSED